MMGFQRVRGEPLLLVSLMVLLFLAGVLINVRELSISAISGNVVNLLFLGFITGIGLATIRNGRRFERLLETEEQVLDSLDRPGANNEVSRRVLSTIITNQRHTLTEAAVSLQSADQEAANPPRLTEFLSGSDPLRADLNSVKPFTGVISGLPADSCLEYSFESLSAGYCSGEPLKANDLTQSLMERLTQRLEFLKRGSDAAVALGFAGTLVGVILQVVTTLKLTKHELYSSAFLGGVLVAVTTTLQGLAVSSTLLRRYNLLATRASNLAAQIVRYVQLNLMPVLTDVNRPALAAVAVTEHVVEKLNQASAGIVSSIGAALERLSTQYTALVKEATDNLGRSVDSLKTGINKAIGSLQSTLDTVSDAIREANARPDAVAESLTTAIYSANTVAERFTELDGSLNGFTQEIRQALDQAVTIAAVLSGAEDAREHALTYAIKQLNEAVAAQKTTAQSVANLASKIPGEVVRLESRAGSAAAQLENSTEQLEQRLQVLNSHIERLEALRPRKLSWLFGGNGQQAPVTTDPVAETKREGRPN